MADELSIINPNGEASMMWQFAQYMYVFYLQGPAVARATRLAPALSGSLRLSLFIYPTATTQMKESGSLCSAGLFPAENDNMTKERETYPVVPTQKARISPCPLQRTVSNISLLYPSRLYAGMVDSTCWSG